MSQLEATKRWRAANPEKYKEMRDRQRSKIKATNTRRQKFIIDRAKKVRAKLDSIAYCDMAEILFGDEPLA